MNFLSPFLESHIEIILYPSQYNFYAVSGSEFLRRTRINSSKEEFQKLIGNLLTKMYRKGCLKTQLKRLLNKLFCKHFETFKKFADNTNIFH